MSAELTLTNFWSHAIAAALFVSLIVWRVRTGVRQPAQRLMLAGFALTGHRLVNLRVTEIASRRDRDTQLLRVSLRLRAVTEVA